MSAPGGSDGSALAARRRYAALVAEVDPPLEEAAATLSLLGDPGADVAGVLTAFDALAAEVAARVASDRAPEAADVDAVLFGVHGFRGNSEHYQDPRNSYLDQVLRRRVGIPITLAVVYVAVARRVGIDAEGIGFPGHFLVRVKEAGAPAYLDAFSRGQRLDEQALAARLSVLSGGRAELHERHLAPVRSRQILSRMLANLRSVHAQARAHAPLLEAIEWALLTTPEDASLRRERGLVYYAVGHLPAARRDLVDYLERIGRSAADRDGVAELVARIDSGGGNLTLH